MIGRRLAPRAGTRQAHHRRAACRAFVNAPKLPLPADRGSEPGFPTRAAPLSDADANALAAACEAFTRFPPAGILPGTRLYPEQVQAAVHLVRGALVQMDTGEGKTYALMVAALAPLRRHRRVYIVTANPYLAIRDAEHTLP